MRKNIHLTPQTLVGLGKVLGSLKIARRSSDAAGITAALGGENGKVAGLPVYYWRASSIALKNDVEWFESFVERLIKAQADGGDV